MLADRETDRVPIERCQHFGRRWPRSRKIWA